MAENFLTFKVINDREVARDFSDVLKQSNIPFYVEEDVLNFDPSYANNPLQKDYRVKIRQQDFDAAGKAFEDFYRSHLENVEKDYYLFDFTDAELQEVISKQDEWGYLDYELAKKILVDRGNELTPVRYSELKNKRIIELAAPEKIKIHFIFLAYVAAFFFFPAGIFVGWYWRFGKKALPNGDLVLTFNESIRNHGITIFAIGIGMGCMMIGKLILR